MRPQKIEEKALMNGLMYVFQSKGFDGASLNDLSFATGLKKASLYHRFPGGKNDMAVAVVKLVEEWIEYHVVSILADKIMHWRDRLGLVLDNLVELYQQGSNSCILRVFSLDLGIELVGEELKIASKKFISAFYSFGLELGINDVQAQKSANEVFIKIQGGLILSKIMGDNTIFSQVIQDVEKLYTLK